MRLSWGWHRKEANSGKGLIVTNQARIGHSQVAVKLWEGGDSVLERVDGTELQDQGGGGGGWMQSWTVSRKPV